MLARSTSPPLSIYDSEKTFTSVSSVVEVDVQALLPQLRCPICLCFLNDTYTVMECLHRFCKECIHRVLRLDKKTLHKCPSCNLPMGHRRTLRKDVFYDEIVALLRPPSEDDEHLDLIAIEESRRKAIEGMRKRSAAQANLNGGLTSPPKGGARAAASLGVVDMSQQQRPPPPPSAFVVHLKLELRGDIEGSSEDHPVPPMERPYLKILANAKVSAVKQFIKSQYDLSDDQGVFLSIYYENQVLCRLSVVHRRLLTSYR